MNLEEMRVKRLIKSIEKDIVPPSELKKRVLSNIMSNEEVSINQQYIVFNNLALKLVKITFPVTILLTMIFGLEAY